MMVNDKIVGFSPLVNESVSLLSEQSLLLRKHLEILREIIGKRKGRKASWDVKEGELDGFEIFRTVIDYEEERIKQSQ